MKDNKKILIMCEGPNELAVINILLENKRFKFSNDDLLNLVPYHSRQISGVVKTSLNLYSGYVIILRVGDTLNDKLKLRGYNDKVKEVYKICTKPELEMLLIIAEGLVYDYNKYKSKEDAKSYAKSNIKLGKKKYDNSTKFFVDYFGDNVDLLVESIKRYKHIKKHNRDEYFLADLLI